MPNVRDHRSRVGDAAGAGDGACIGARTVCGHGIGALVSSGFGFQAVRRRSGPESLTLTFSDAFPLEDDQRAAAGQRLLVPAAPW